MIKKVKKRFILLTLASILLLFSILVAAMNLVNYRYVVRESDNLLEFLSRNHGTFPEPGGDHKEPLPPHMSPEIPYETRYFSVLFREDGAVLSVETSRIASVDREAAVRLAKEALRLDRTKGSVENYRFCQREEGDMIRITFLDHRSKMDACFRYFLFSVFSSGITFVIVSLIILLFANRLIRPISESYEKQTQFIANAGHEIKTPLTIINANVDILEMEYGSNEGFDEVRTQSERLASLTEELVLLTRMEEAENALRLIEFPVSEVVEDATAHFKVIAANENLLLQTDIKPMLSMHGDQKAIAQLVSILMDNAMKYTPTGGTVSISLKKQSRGVALSIWNDTKQPVDTQQK